MHKFYSSLILIIISVSFAFSSPNSYVYFRICPNKPLLNNAYRKNDITLAEFFTLSGCESAKNVVFWPKQRAKQHYHSYEDTHTITSEGEYLGVYNYTDKSYIDVMTASSNKIPRSRANGVLHLYQR